MTQTRRTVDRGRLKELREDAGLSYRMLAVRMADDPRGPGSPTYLWKIESGHPDAAGVTPFYLKRIADALGVPLDAFTTREPVDRAA